MTGYRVAFTADVRTRPDVTDASSYLNSGLAALRAHSAVADAAYRYSERACRVTIEVVLRAALPPHLTALHTEALLHEALGRAGICTSRTGAAGRLPPVQVRLPRWPDWFQRR